MNASGQPDKPWFSLQSTPGIAVAAFLLSVDTFAILLCFELFLGDLGLAGIGVLLFDAIFSLVLIPYYAILLKSLRKSIASPAIDLWLFYPFIILSSVVFVWLIRILGIAALFQTSNIPLR